MSADGIERVQVTGTWQPSSDGAVKGLEDGSSVGVVAVKVLPRQYETPTIPDGSVQVEVQLVMRSDSDPTGKDYLQTTETIQGAMQLWQRDFGLYHEDFSTVNGFEPTGFRLDGGDCGLDKENAIWTFAQSFTMFGNII